MHAHSIEILEARIAPASVFHYTDIDGDKVTLTSSVGDLNVAGITTLSGGTSGVLQLLDLHNGGFEMANLTFTVVKVADGDGLANVGYINDSGHRLGNVIIKGDLGRIDGGLGRMSLNDPRVPAVKSLTVTSMGRLGTDTQTAASPSLDSLLIDGLGALTVKGDLKDVFLNVTGKVGALTIGGSFLGLIDAATTVNNRGVISCVGIGAVKIGGDLEGGIISRDPATGDVTIGGSLIGIFFTYYSSKAVKVAHDVFGTLGAKLGSGLGKVTIGGSVTPTGYIVGQSTGIASLKIAHDMAGAIYAGGTIPSLIIGGSVIGGDTVGNGALDGHLPGTGRVEAHRFGTVKIGGDVRGGSVENSGSIEGTITFTSLTIGGSLIGGTATNTGTITGNHGFASVKIGHDLIGGSISGTDSLDRSGVILGYDRIGSITIGGSIISGLDASTGSLTNNATIRVGFDIGALTIGGNILGHADTGTGASPVIITASGQLFPGAKADIAIGKLTVGRTVEFARILAGYNSALTAVNADAQIGPVKIGGDWVASSIVAGVSNTASSNTNFGNTGDAIAAGPTVHDTPGLHSRIASITIARQIFGTPQSLSATDSFGFVAEQIGSLKIGGYALPLPANTTPQSLGGTSDLSIHLVA